MLRGFKVPATVTAENVLQAALCRSCCMDLPTQTEAPFPFGKVFTGHKEQINDICTDSGHTKWKSSICFNIVGFQSDFHKKRKELGCKDTEQQEMEVWNYMQNNKLILLG